MSLVEPPSGALPETGRLVADLQEERALEIVRQSMAWGDDPFQIIDDCQVGMRLVGERYARQRYFLAALIMAGEILPDHGARPACHGGRARRTRLGPHPHRDRAGGHPHLGKNLVIWLLRSHGFAVLDLGIDVAPDAFVEAARHFEPQIIGLSGPITADYASMRETVAALREMMAEDRCCIPIILGG